MMAKDNFDFDTEGKGKLNLDFAFLKNLTQKQKETILMIAIAVVAVIVIVVIGVIVLTGGNGGNNGGNNTGNVGGGTSNGDSTENGDSSDGGSEMPAEILEFHIASAPTKTTYYVGDEIDYEGLFFYYRNSDDRSEHIYYADDPDAFTITGFDSSVPVENQVITVSYGKFSDTFTVNILEVPVVPPTLERIYIDPMPKTEYSVGDIFLARGAKIVLEFSNGMKETRPLEISNLSGFGAAINTPGEHEIKVVFVDEEKGYYAETSFTIIVTE